MLCTATRNSHYIAVPKKPSLQLAIILKNNIFFLQVFNFEVLFFPLNLALSCACQLFKRMRLRRASPICLRLDFPGVFLLLIEELSGQCTALAGQGGEQEPAPGVLCSRMKDSVQISQRQGQSAHPFFTKTVHPCIACKFC